LDRIAELYSEQEEENLRIFSSVSRYIARFIFAKRNKCVNFKTGLDDMNRKSAPGNDISKG